MSGHRRAAWSTAQAAQTEVSAGNCESSGPEICTVRKIAGGERRRCVCVFAFVIGRP